MDATRPDRSDAALPPDRRLIVVVHIDMVGYSRLIAQDDRGTMARLSALRKQVMEPEAARHHGRIVQVAGDSILMVFDSIDRAAACSITIQERIPAEDPDPGVGSEIRFRLGVHIGDVVVDDSGYHGDGINVAARLQQACPAGGVCISRAVHDLLHVGLRQRFQRLGVLTFKNIVQPVEAFSLRTTGILPAQPHPVADPVLVSPPSDARPLAGFRRLRTLFASAETAQATRPDNKEGAGREPSRFVTFERSNDFLAAADDSRLPALLERTRQSMWMVGSTFYITVGQYRALILAKLAEGVAVHLLIQRPGGRALPTMAALLGVTAEELTLDCLSGIRVLQRTLSDARRAGHDSLLRVRLLDEPFQTRFYLFDPGSAEGWTFFVPQVAGINSQTIPGFLVPNRSAPWVARYVDVIQAAWNGPNALPLEDWDGQ